MPVSGGSVVAGNIKKFGEGFLKHVNKHMTIVKEMLDDKVTRNISLRDHNLEYLAKMDHPYASRHGSQGKPIHDPYWLIHAQGGRLLASKKSGIEEASITGGKLNASAFVGLDESIAPYAPYLIWGTSKMIPRDALAGSLFDPSFQEQAKAHLQENLRDMVFNFQGAETK